MAESRKKTPAASASVNDASSLSRGYTVLARRYRPQQFDDCVGQEHVVRSLKNAIEAKRVAHAYLFTGSRGVGKTSMARIFAKALNCVHGPTITPCDECDNCLSIASGDDVDVIEIDGASNRGIDEVRELRQGVNYRPSRSNYKIYIIDEVHMLTKEAFNALLKTLEEPPAHAKFLFATTEVQKIPITILSRCQRFDFAGIEQSKIMTRLREIVESEGMAADDEALELIARRAGGSMRDSQSLLDQVLAFGGETLTADDVHRVMGTAGDERVAELVASILAGDSAAALSAIASAVAAGVQLGEWIEQTLGYFRDLMVLSVNPEAELVSVPSRMRPTLLEQTQALAPEALIERMDLLAACRARMRASSYGRTLVEMTAVRLCRLDQFLSVDSILQSTPPVAAPSRSVAPAKVSPPPAEKKNDEVAPPTPAIVPDPDPEPRPAELEPRSQPAAVRITLDAANIANFWKEVGRRLDDPMLSNMIQQVLGVSFAPPATIDVRFAADHAYFKTYCEEPSRLAKVEKACMELAGGPVIVRFAQSTEASATPKLRTNNNQQQLREKAARDPMVRKAEQILGARLIKVDPIETTAPAANETSIETNDES